MADYLRAMRGEQGAEQLLDRYGVSSAMLAYHGFNARLIRRLLDAGWVCVHATPGPTPIVLLVRPTEASRPLIERFGGGLPPP
jgi:hypothetical protein